MKKRIFSLLLALLMVVSAVPVPTHAADEPAAPTETTAPAETTAPTETTAPAETIAPAETTVPTETTAPAETEAAAPVAPLAETVEDTPVTEPPVDNCPWCEETTAEDGTVTHAIGCNAAWAYDGSADVGKYAQLSAESIEYGLLVVPSTDAEETIQFFAADFQENTVFHITGWHWDSVLTGIWYQVEFHSGGVVEAAAADWPATAWVLQGYSDDAADAPALVFVTICSVCGGVNCEKEHPICGFCGKPDCAVQHNICPVCGNANCSEAHLYCRACGSAGCDKTHIWCGTCAKYDCGLTHESLAPVTVPVIPENPTLPENVEVSILDAEGNALSALTLTPFTRTSVSAWSVDGEAVSYQWQIRYDAASDLWVNIQGQTRKGMLLSPAVVRSILTSQGSAAVRCVVTAGEQTRTSAPIPVTISGTGSSSGTSAAALPLADGETGDGENTGGNLKKAYVVVQYLYDDGRTAATSDFAEIVPGQAYTNSYDLHDIPGYQATLENASQYDSYVELEGSTLKVNYPADELTKDYTIITVKYIPTAVNVTVIHYWQNVNNDNYTEYERQAVTDFKTGDQVKDVHNEYNGFFNLLYETPAAAADGSTVIEVYYDRYYYLMTFDLGGGYGVDPIYARYGTPIEITTPTRAGYTFAGWVDEAGNPVTIPDTMPVDGGKYSATWTPLESVGYRVTYWVLNDNDTKTLLGSHIEYGASGSKVDGVDNLATDYGTICGEELSHVHGDACYDCNQPAHNHTLDCFKTFGWENENTDAAGQDIIAEAGNESGYIYAIYSTESDTYWPKLYLDGKYYIVKGISGVENESDYASIVEGEALTTVSKNYGNKTLTVKKYQAKTVCGSIQHAHSSCGLTCTEHAHTDECYCQDTRYMEFVSADKDVVINGDGSSIVNVYYRYKEYTLKFYYAASSTGTGSTPTYKVVGLSTYFFGGQHSGAGIYEQYLNSSTMDMLNRMYAVTFQWGETAGVPGLNERGQQRVDQGIYTLGSDTNNNGVTYHYISFKARYGDNISEKWPCDVLAPVEMKEEHTNPRWNRNYAVASAWNGEHHVWYSKHNQNETIKGIYEKLDYKILYDSAFADSTTVSYLCFWENGANGSGDNKYWNIPELYRYNIYLEAYGGQDLTGKTTVKRTDDEGEERTYYLADSYDTCDNSTVGEQTQVALTGYEPVTFTTPRDGFRIDKFEYRTLTGTTDSTLLQQGGYFNQSLYSEGYEVNFYYNTKKYKLSFWNYDGYLTDGTGSEVAYKEPLKKYFEGTTVGNTVYDGANDLIAKEEYYPDGLEPGAYKFEGWYTSANFEDETKVDPTTAQMPDEALMVYAKWVPVVRTVRFFLDRSDLEDNKTIPVKMAELYAAANNGAVDADSPYATKFATRDNVPNGSKIDDLSAPGVDGSGDDKDRYEKIHPYAGYKFVGWFYLNEAGEEIAFDPENMPVAQDLDLYGKWSSDKLCYYNVYFALDDGTGQPKKDESGNIIYVADPVSGSGIAGRTYTFTAKGGEELHVPYRSGYFPNVGSHSLTIDIKDENGTAANAFTFLYRQKDKVPYTVKYLEAGTGAELHTQKTVDDNKNIVVTENFVYINGYMPDAYQKTLVVTDGGVNEIVFYYTKDTQHSLYVVNHYIEELDAQLEHKGWSKYTDLQSTGDIGTTYSADALTIDGFTLSTTYTDGYNTGEKPVNGMTGVELPATVSALTNGKISGELTEMGMELNFYYTRNLYPYEFRYMLQGTNTELAKPEFAKAGFDTYVEGAAKVIEMDLDNDGNLEDYRLYDPTETTKTIHIKKDGDPLTADKTVTEGQAKVNVATFYYVRCTQTMTITKRVEDKGANSDPDMDREYKISLLINATSGYHQSSYAYTKTAGETDVATGTLAPVYNTLQFTLKAGQTITIEGLPTAEYTVSELDLPVGYYDTYFPAAKNKLTVNAPVDVTVTNTYDPATLTIGKVVDVVETGTNTPEVKDFEFTVFFPQDVTPAASYTYTVSGQTMTAAVTGNAMTIRLEKGQTATFENLPTGAYTVTEKDYSALGYDSNYSINDAALVDGNAASVTLTRGQTTAVRFENKFPVGTITINKTVAKEFAADNWAGDTFTFTLERTNTDRPLIEGNQYRYQLDGVTQTDADGKALLLRVEKGLLTGTISFGENETGSHTLTVLDLPAGTYLVKETGSDKGLEQYITTVDETTAMEKSVELKKDAFDHTVSITNTLKRYYGTLEITKDVQLEGVTVIPDADKLQLFEIYVTLTGDPDFTGEVDVAYSEDAGTRPAKITAVHGVLTVAVMEDETVTLSNVPAVTYTVTEKDYSAKGYDEVITLQEGLELEVEGAWKITKGLMTSKVLVTNRYPVRQGTLTITKTVENTPAGENQPFIFHITGNGVDMDVTINGAGSVTISEMPLGTYTVTEDTSWSWRYTCTDGATKTATIEAQKTNAAVTFNNKYENSKWVNFVTTITNVFTQSTDSGTTGGNS